MSVGSFILACIADALQVERRSHFECTWALSSEALTIIGFAMGFVAHFIGSESEIPGWSSSMSTATRIIISTTNVWRIEGLWLAAGRSFAGTSIDRLEAPTVLVSRNGPRIPPVWPMLEKSNPIPVPAMASCL